MSSVILAELGGDAYRDATLRADNPTRRYTAYAVYPVDPSETIPSSRLLAAVRDGDAYVEEIDVDAATERHAREIAEAALARDYDPGGRIVGVEERVGLYL